jgi:hypothetical protein
MFIAKRMGKGGDRAGLTELTQCARCEGAYGRLGVIDALAEHIEAGRALQPT